jgi:leucyl-tRNA synthetase
MFTAPPEATLEWNDAGVEGSYRFLRRVWNFGVKLSAMDLIAARAHLAGARGLKGIEFGKQAKVLRREMHTVLKQVDYDYQRMQYNTVVSGAMKMINALERPPQGASTAESSPPAVCWWRCSRASPFCCVACTRPRPTLPTHCGVSWGTPCLQGDLLDAPWPEVDPAALVQDEVELVLQINGKLRGSVVVPAGATKESHRGRRAGQRYLCAVCGRVPRPRRLLWCRADWSMWLSRPWASIAVVLCSGRAQGRWARP